jgi:integrase
MRPLPEHLEAWHRSIVADGRTTEHADLVKARAEKIITGCGFARFAEIDAEQVKAWLAEQRAGGMSVQTSNHYVRAIKQFSTWMVDVGRAASSPVARLKMSSVAGHRKRERRALTLAEFTKLVETAHAGPKRYKLTGPKRAIVYLLARETGFRAAELRSLRRSSFTLDGDRPSVTVAAGYAKNRRQDVLTISSDLAARLRLLVAKLAPNDRVFDLPTKTAAMLRADLADAEIAYADDDGRVFDFHSLRGQCATDLIRAGVGVKVAQRRLRHSNVQLTLDVYTSLGVAEAEDEAVAALPTIRLADAG